MAERWYPPAIRDPFPDAGGFVEGYTWRGVLHSTEGKDYDGARSVYKSGRVPPHFTGELELDADAPEGSGFHVWQHIPIDRAARALENPEGGVETNRAHCIQIEVVARADNPDWPLGLVDGIRRLMVWIEAQTGIRPWSPTFQGAAAFGLKAMGRMTAYQWKRFDGWCGHQHVPENRHWDPGAINPVMAALLAREEVSPPMIPAPVHDYEEATTKTIQLHIGPLDKDGNGWGDWQPGLGRDPVPVAVTLLGPSPADDGYWPNQAGVQLSAQPRGGSLRVVVRGGTPGDTVTCYATVA